jgi:hypothetical protein
MQPANFVDQRGIPCSALIQRNRSGRQAERGPAIGRFTPAASLPQRRRGSCHNYVFFALFPWFRPAFRTILGANLLIIS